jgi:hypothetical protein
MSRGHGKTQRALLAILRRHKRSPHALSTIELANRVYQVRQTRFFSLRSKAKEVAVRRALASLQREGLVVGLGNQGFGHEHYWRAASRERPRGPSLTVAIRPR